MLTYKNKRVLTWLSNSHGCRVCGRDRRWCGLRLLRLSFFCQIFFASVGFKFSPFGIRTNSERTNPPLLRRWECQDKRVCILNLVWTSSHIAATARWFKGGIIFDRRHFAQRGCYWENAHLFKMHLSLLYAYCSSQPSMVHWLRSPIFPCSLFVVPPSWHPTKSHFYLP